MGRLSGINLIHDRTPEKSTIWAFRNLPKKHELAQSINYFGEDFVYGIFNTHLRARGWLTFRQGKLVASNLIAAPRSTLTGPKPEWDGDA